MKMREEENRVECNKEMRNEKVERSEVPFAFILPLFFFFLSLLWCAGTNHARHEGTRRRGNRTKPERAGLTRSMAQLSECASESMIIILFFVFFVCSFHVCISYLGHVFTGNIPTKRKYGSAM